MMWFLGHLFVYLLCYSLHFVEATHSLGIYKSSKKHTCRFDESSALLDFKNSFKSYEDLKLKIWSWRNGTDCCEWDGVACNPATGHVISLDLSNARFHGTINSKSSLFLLSRLVRLDLSYNNFEPSTISPKFGLFLHLKYLNLSRSKFSGEVPAELSHLRNLTSLDLLGNDKVKLAMPTFEAIIENLTKLKELDLSYVSIDYIPESLTTLSSLESLRLSDCGLRGQLPSNILALSHLRLLHLHRNDQLYTGNVVELSTWSSPLEQLSLAITNFSRQLPHSVSPAFSNSLWALSLYNCSAYGPIPTWVWNATELDLSLNDFTGKLPSSLNVTLTHLSGLYLSFNSLNGTIPSWLFRLPSITYLYLDFNHFESINKLDNVSISNLVVLDLSSNFISGTIDLNMFANLKYLESLEFSNNSLSIMTDEVNSTSSWPNLTSLGLSSCNLSKFPLLASAQALDYLDLSNNSIQGAIPRWFRDLEIVHLDVSHNHLTGDLENLPWKSLEAIDISNNKLKGELPVWTASNLTSLLASNNRISGSIDSSICNSVGLTYLDLSNNTLDGQVPNCLGNLFNHLTALNLRSNNLSSIVPLNFSSCEYLMDLDLSYNQFEGTLPHSLSRCNKLEVLDLGNNKFNDTFPYWLGMLSKLQVLVLRSNDFHGHVTMRSYSRKLFRKLRVIDMSNNGFSGILPSRFIKNMWAMRYMEYGEDVGQYLGDKYDGYFSITITVKGTDFHLERILNTLTTIDVSSNMFEGEIPASVGELRALRWLNFSHNKFSKQIPTSIGNLRDLESLDLSCNHLSGEIPQELGSLTFLEVFNVSENQLVGPIPGTTQLSSLSNSSYIGNPGLCGAPLSNKCVNEDAPTSTSQPDDGSDNTDTNWMSEIHLWEVILTGFSVGWAAGVVAGYFILSATNPLWLARFLYLLEY